MSLDDRLEALAQTVELMATMQRDKRTTIPEPV
jgi:hypothetical protein